MAERMIPGGFFFIETATSQSQIPGGPFVNSVVASAAAHTLTGSNSAQSNTSSTGTITQSHALAVAGGAKGNTASTAAVTQTHSLAGANSAQANNSGTGSISQVHNLAATGSSTGNTSATGSITQVHNLTAVASAVGNLSSNGTLTAVHSLTAASSVISNQSESIAVSSAAPPTSYTMWGNSSETPVVPAANDNTGINLGVRFKVSSPGYVSAVLFYKGASGLHTGYIGNLWNPDGSWKAATTATNISSTGWVRLEFSTPVLLEADTVYTASYFSPEGLYAATLNYFSVGKTNGPLYFLASGEGSVANGLFRYASEPALPSSSFQDANYWVDVEFIPSAGFVSLTGSNSTQANTASNGTITQTQILISENCVQQNLSNTGSISVTVNLSGSNSTQSNTASTGAIQRTVTLTGANSIQPVLSSVSAITVSQFLTVSNSAIANSSPSVNMGAPSSDLVGSNALLSNTSSTGAVTQVHNLTAAGSTTPNTSSVGSIGRVVDLTAAASVQFNASPSVAINRTITLTGASGVVANTATVAAISQSHVLVVPVSSVANQSTTGSVSLIVQLTVSGSVNPLSSSSVAVFIGAYAPLGKVHVAVAYSPFKAKYLGSPYAVTLAPQLFKVSYER